MRSTTKYLLLLAAILAALGGWYLAWQRIAAETRAGIEQWLAERRLEGYDAGHNGLAIGGFPFRIQAVLTRPWLARPHATLGWHWQGERLSATAQVWELRHVIAQHDGEQRITWREAGQRRRATANAELARASIVAGGTGQWERISVDLAQPRLAGDPGPWSAERLTAHARRAEAGLELAIDALRIGLPPHAENPLGRSIAHVRASGTATGAWPGEIAVALAGWRESGGALELSAIFLAWGPLEITGDGTLALDREMRPIGAMSAELRGYAETIDALAQGGVLKRGDAQLIKAGLALAARADGQGRPHVKLPISAQDGQLFLGPLAVARLPPLVPPPNGRNPPR